MKSNYSCCIPCTLDSLPLILFSNFHDILFSLFFNLAALQKDDTKYEITQRIIYVIYHYKVMIIYARYHGYNT